MASRRQARERALALLYAADLRGRPIGEVLTAARASEDPPSAFTVELVVGVGAERGRMDALITAYARDWTIERMPVVDRNILRLGMWELHHSDVPPAVAINEAVDLAKDLSTDDSGRWINGILARAARRREADEEADPEANGAAGGTDGATDETLDGAPDKAPDGAPDDTVRTEDAPPDW